ncbi:MAG: hypothetical protein WCC48_01320 [Anaeromyxobacteraceae bacterium]
MLNLSAMVYAAMILAPLVYLDYYTFYENAANHTSIPIALMLVGYCVSFVAALSVVKRQRLRGAWGLWFVLIVSAVAIANIVVFDAANVMMEKDRWFSKGMPER